MDGENNGSKPYEQMDDLGVFPYFWKHPNLWEEFLQDFPEKTWGCIKFGVVFPEGLWPEFGVAWAPIFFRLKYLLKGGPRADRYEKTRWWQLKDFFGIFTPILGEDDSPFWRYNIFWDGWAETTN